ncbi:hypothetical protein GCM10009775_32890 [Microbacterium aoyamense]|uniref:Uncharacterized protein n=1 Tax=Microbacterium aoyamense TaxID=344166 RepID=A0ABP5B9T7_9MICO
MGARLVGEAIAYAVDVPLTGNEYRLLIGMSHTALDGAIDDPRESRRYFDSRDAMCLAIGRRVNDHDATDRAAAFEAVRVALRGLVSLGAIEQLKRGQSGQRAEFNLVIEAEQSRTTAEYRRRALSKRARPRPPKPQAQPGPAPQAQPGPAPQAQPGPAPQAQPGPAPQAQPGPKEPQRNHRGKTRGITSTHSTVSLASVDKSIDVDESEAAA